MSGARNEAGAWANAVPMGSTRWWCQPLTWLWHTGVACIVLAAFLFSCGTLTVRLLESSSQQPGGPEAVPAFEVAFIPAAISWTLLTMWKARLPAGTLPFVSPDKWVCLLTILRGLFGAVSLTLLYIALELLPLQTAVAIFFCHPFIAATLEWLVHGDNLNAGSVTGSLLTVAGVFLVTQRTGLGGGVAVPGGPPATVSLGVAVALLSAACNAVAFVLVRHLGGRQSAVTLTWWYHLILMTISATVLASRPSSHPVALTSGQALLMAGVCGAQFGGQILMNRGFQLLSATRGSAINVLQVLFSYMWDVLILHDALTLPSALGGLCVMVGVVFVALCGAAPPPKQPSSGDPAGAASLEDPEHPHRDYLLVSSEDDGAPGHGHGHPDAAMHRRASFEPRFHGGADTSAPQHAGVHAQLQQPSSGHAAFPGYVLHASHGMVKGRAWALRGLKVGKPGTHMAAPAVAVAADCTAAAGADTAALSCGAAAETEAAPMLGAQADLPAPVVEHATSGADAAGMAEVTHVACDSSSGNASARAVAAWHASSSSSNPTVFTPAVVSTASPSNTVHQGAVHAHAPATTGWSRRHVHSHADDGLPVDPHPAHAAHQHDPAHATLAHPASLSHLPQAHHPPHPHPHLPPLHPPHAHTTPHTLPYTTPHTVPHTLPRSPWSCGSLQPRLSGPTQPDASHLQHVGALSASSSTCAIQQVEAAVVDDRESAQPRGTSMCHACPGPGACAHTQLLQSHGSGSQHGDRELHPGGASCAWDAPSLRSFNSMDSFASSACSSPRRASSIGHGAGHSRHELLRHLLSGHRRSSECEMEPTSNHPH